MPPTAPEINVNRSLDTKPPRAIALGRNSPAIIQTRIKYNKPTPRPWYKPLKPTLLAEKKLPANTLIHRIAEATHGKVFSDRFVK